jgi:uncharacterized protein YkwD
MSVLSSPARRVLPLLLLIATLVVALAPLPAAAVQAPSNPEAQLLSLVNDARRGIDRVPLRWDNRLADVAQDRSDDMVAKGYFGHVAGWTEMVNAKGIKWYRLGETLAKTPPNASAIDAAGVAMQTWRDSQAHWDLLSGTDFNYIAIGMARAKDGWYYWTALLLKGPDRTRPVAEMVAARKGSISGGKRPVAVSWKGHDVKLSVLTAGLRDFKLQRKVGSGSWVTVVNWTTRTSRSFDLTVGRTYRFRVKSRDWAGNKSRLSAALTVKP